MNTIQENYIVEVNDPNKIFNLNGRDVRSPFKAVISSKDLDRFLLMIKLNSVNNYSVNKSENYD